MLDTTSPAFLDACRVRDDDYKVLTEHVRVAANTTANTTTSSGPRRRPIKLLCIVYAISKQHDKIEGARTTWGPKCDGFVTLSDQTNQTLGTAAIAVKYGEDDYNMWQKIRSIWAYVYDNYYEPYDWFHLGRDDLYVIVGNLRQYLESDEIRTAVNGGIYLPTRDEFEQRQIPVLLGRRFKYTGKNETIYASGGPGYTIN